MKERKVLFTRIDRHLFCFHFFAQYSWPGETNHWSLRVQWWFPVLINGVLRSLCGSIFNGFPSHDSDAGWKRKHGGAEIEKLGRESRISWSKVLKLWHTPLSRFPIPNCTIAYVLVRFTSQKRAQWNREACKKIPHVRKQRGHFIRNFESNVTRDEKQFPGERTRSGTSNQIWD